MYFCITNTMIPQPPLLKPDGDCKVRDMCRVQRTADTIGFEGWRGWKTFAPAWSLMLFTTASTSWFVRWPWACPLVKGSGFKLSPAAFTWGTMRIVTSFPTRDACVTRDKRRHANNVSSEIITGLVVRCRDCSRKGFLANSRVWTFGHAVFIPAEGECPWNQTPQQCHVSCSVWQCLLWRSGLRSVRC